MTAVGELSNEAVLIKSLQAALARTPDGVEYGIHLCYGDSNHQHFAVPRDLSLCVKIANAVGAGAAFVHMPADRETGQDPGYFEPLRDLSAQRLALGVIDYEGGQQRTAALGQPLVGAPARAACRELRPMAPRPLIRRSATAPTPSC